MTLGALQSAAALARAAGPLVGGALYASIDPRAPYLAGAVGPGAAGLLAVARLRAVAPRRRRGLRLLLVR